MGVSLGQIIIIVLVFILIFGDLSKILKSIKTNLDRVGAVREKKQGR